MRIMWQCATWASYGFTRDAASRRLLNSSRTWRPRWRALAVDLALADSYKYDEVLDAMDAAGVSWPVEKVAFGARSFRAVRTAQNLVIGRKVRMAPNLALVEAVKNSSLNTIDRVGNQRVEKAGARTRIDVLSAFVLASLHAEPVLSNPDPAEQEFFAV